MRGLVRLSLDGKLIRGLAELFHRSVELYELAELRARYELRVKSGMQLALAFDLHLMGFVFLVLGYLAVLEVRYILLCYI